MSHPIRDLQLLFVGMCLAAPRQLKEDGIVSDDFADADFAQLVACLQYDDFGTSEKQDAIRHFVGQQLGYEITEPEHWREELLGLLRVNGEFGRVINRLRELEHFNVQTKEGQLAFLRHAKHILPRTEDDVPSYRAPTL